MKRFAIVFLVLCLLLCACGKEPAPTEPTTVATTEATTEAPTTEATEPPVVYHNPLNGQTIDAPYTGRPVAVVINNLRDALPHHGVSEADFMFELETEGGITRMLAVFSELPEESTIGPVRSARSFFNNIALSFDAPIAHCGGSVRGRNGYSDLNGDKISNWQHIDEQSNGSYFFRDMDRNNRGYSWEHTLFTNGAKLKKAMEAKEYYTNEERDYGLQFAENVKLDSFIAEQITVSFRGGKTSSFNYDADTGLYTMRQYNDSYTDANTGANMTFKNVMVLYTEQTFVHDGDYNRSYYELEGEGNGYLAINGEIVKINWSRTDRNAPFVYTLEDGTPVTLGIGHTYVGVAGDTATPVEYK